MAGSELPPALAELHARARCLGAEIGERPVVFGDGNPTAVLMLVGEAPGEQEEKQGRPFVGPAGRLLDRTLASLGIDRGELWITNIVKQRPVTEVDGRVMNRAPRAGEVKAWAPILAAELELIRPAAMLCLGAPAANALIHRQFRLTEERGRWFNGPAGTRIAATFHPAYVLRLVGEDYERAKNALRDDLAAAWGLARQLRQVG